LHGAEHEVASVSVDVASPDSDDSATPLEAPCQGPVDSVAESKAHPITAAKPSTLVIHPVCLIARAF
jgi:hypothetical protein